MRELPFKREASIFWWETLFGWVSLERRGTPLKGFPEGRWTGLTE